jgi:hypothetical protein
MGILGQKKYGCIEGYRDNSKNWRIVAIIDGG